MENNTIHCLYEKEEQSKLIKTIKKGTFIYYINVSDKKDRITKFKIRTVYDRDLVGVLNDKALLVNKKDFGIRFFLNEQDAKRANKIWLSQFPPK